jgi:hypothetical protein
MVVGVKIGISRRLSKREMAKGKAGDESYFKAL